MSSIPLIFAHIGDLHITKAKEQNYIDLLSIIAQIETELGDQLDFVLLPGDNADNGLPQQYKLVATALKMLSVPVYIIAGDHDMEQGSLQNMYQMPQSQQLTLSVSIKGKRCLFIDVCGSGSGGPDFRIGQTQFEWLEKELKKGKKDDETTLLFMHTFPSDLKEPEEQSRLNRLIETYGVTLVDMGHTHYNEITNNGHTVFTATRSTGQIEEGPVGYSIVTIHDGIVSWRFKHLADPFPFVMITKPADYRMLNNANQLINGSYEIAALALGSRKITQVSSRAGTTHFNSMNWDDQQQVWLGTTDTVAQILNELTVQATDESGRPGQWTIKPATQLYRFPERIGDGSDADTIGAWPENGVLGTQLGPNSNGKP